MIKFFIELIVWIKCHLNCNETILFSIIEKTKLSHFCFIFFFFLSFIQLLIKLQLHSILSQLIYPFINPLVIILLNWLLIISLSHYSNNQSPLGSDKRLIVSINLLCWLIWLTEKKWFMFPYSSPWKSEPEHVNMIVKLSKSERWKWW